MSQTGSIEVLESTGAVRPDSGSREMGQQAAKCEPKWKAIGVVYVRADNGIIEVKVFYESHVPQAVKDELAARFGAGAVEWKVSA